MTSKSTKRALLSSVLALVICFTMLIGTTFAWFTDSVTSSGNRIQAGNLKVDIVDESGASLVGDGLKFQNVNGETDILWEPGATFRTQAFKIKNAGNLALKFRLLLTGVDGDAELLDVITFAIVKADGTAVDLEAFEATLNAKDDLSEVYYIQGTMATEANNDYQDKTLEGIGVTVVAGQAMNESDSFDDTYDQNGEYPTTSQPSVPTFTVSSAAQLQAAMTPTVSNDELVVNIADNIELAAGETWTPLNLEAYSGNVLKIVINGNGHTIKNLNAPLIGKAFFGNTSIEINDLTLEGSNINSTSDYTGAFAAYADNCKLVKLTNCHLKKSTVVGGKDVGGLIGLCSSPVTIENCSVTECEIKGNGSVGSLVALMSSGVSDQASVISNTCATKNTLVSEKAGTYRVGELIGTSNRPSVQLSNITTAENTCTQSASTGVESGCTATQWIGRITSACTVTGDTSAAIN